MQPTDSDFFEYVSDNRTLRCSIDHGKFSSPVIDFVQVFRSGSTSVSFVTLVFRAYKMCWNVVFATLDNAAGHRSATAEKRSSWQSSSVRVQGRGPCTRRSYKR